MVTCSAALNAPIVFGVTDVTVGVRIETVNDWVTGVAQEYVALPGWLAVMKQVPVATSVTVAPETVQTGLVYDVNVTGRPELAVALSAGGEEPST